MIHIDLEGKSPNEAWLKKAEDLTSQLLRLDSDEARHKLIDDNSKLWGELKPWLRELSHGKCWYSEATVCAGYGHVDHFRPKKEAKDLDGNKEPGYWWLAFKWQNYCFSGSALNVPKSTKFPIRDGTSRIAGPDQDEDDEFPYLLNPIEPDDPGLLSFNEKGKAIPGDPEGEWNRQRAEVTIEILNLNYDPLTRGRQICWEKCDQRVNQALNLMAEVQKQASASKKTKLRAVIRELQQMAARDSQFSAVVGTCVESQGVKWLTKQVLHQ